MQAMALLHALIVNKAGKKVEIGKPAFKTGYSMCTINVIITLACEWRG